jgi:hypothetical protein
MFDIYFVLEVFSILHGFCTQYSVGVHDMKLRM